MNFKSFDPEISSTRSEKSKNLLVPVSYEAQIPTQIVDTNQDSACHMLNLNGYSNDMDCQSFQQDQREKTVHKTKKKNIIHEDQGKKFYECQFCQGKYYNSNQQLGGHTQKKHSKTLNKEQQVRQYPFRQSVRLQIQKK